LSAHALPSMKSGEAAPGRVAQPPFSTYWPCSQFEEIFCSAARFSFAPLACRNLATQIGVRAATTAFSACSAARILAARLVIQPPQENPIAIDAIAPIAIPCRRRVRDSPWRIDGARIALAFRSEGRRDVHPTARRKSWLNEGHCAHRWRRRCQERERKSRYFLVSAAALGQACRLPSLLYFMMLRAKRKVSQGLIRAGSRLF